MKYIVTIFIAFIILSGCSNFDSERNSSYVVSYAGILVVDGKDYIWQGEVLNDEFTADVKIGEVKNKVKKEVKPKQNFESNYLDVGDKIYASKEDKDVLIVKLSDGTVVYMTVSGYYNNG
ncbi:hypothetical protein [Bacillus sp. FJAT-45066]|uniref:hypothetical protein n=1 Tax=Bacillus sp. FJAT-45066 TaxID=2011010 RepID=UPI000BB9BCAF|nr:hypothetical protein [Bacillus sp. FJAT-45066]